MLRSCANAPESASPTPSRVLTDEATRGFLEAGHRNLDRFSWADTAAGLADLYHAREAA